MEGRILESSKTEAGVGGNEMAAKRAGRHWGCIYAEESCHVAVR